MSGGSLNYAYSDIERIAYTIQTRAETLMQKAFAKHLDLVARALHDLEWVYSSDYGPGDEEEAIKKCLSNEFILSVLIDEAKRIRAELDNIISAER